jgi:hypothetical protein
MKSSYYMSVFVSLSLFILSGFTSYVGAAEPKNWSEIPTKTIKLFYPGESTYQWLRSSAHKRANKKVIAGDSCASCHENEEKDMGNLIVAGHKLEPSPIPNKEGYKELKTQAAYDDQYVYFRFQWKSQFNREGRMHNMMRFDGKAWKFYGSHRASSKVRKGLEPPIYEDRLAIMIDDGSVPLFAKQGCWLTCHTGMRNSPDEATKAQVKSHALLGKSLKKSDVRKYLPATRSDENASWNKTKSIKAIAKLKAEGKFLDLMQWRVARSNPVKMADDGYVLEYRLFDKGKKMFSWNVDKKTMTPKFMFDKSKTGYIALKEKNFSNPKKVIAIIKKVNAKAYDSKAGFKKGDILPGRLLTTATSGSAGDNDYAAGNWNKGLYTVVFRRKLDTGHPDDDKILKKGGIYTLGLAVHDDNVTTRFHHVSFPLSLGIGVKADIEALKIKN